MPNQRNVGKKHLNAWIWETDMDELAAVAKDNGMTLTDLVEYLINELKNKQPKEIQQWHQKQQAKKKLN